MTPGDFMSLTAMLAFLLQVVGIGTQESRRRTLTVASRAQVLLCQRVVYSYG